MVEETEFTNKGSYVKFKEITKNRYIKVNKRITTGSRNIMCRIVIDEV